MPLLVTCGHCKKKLQIPDQGKGKSVRCPLCGGVFVAAAAPVTENAPAAPPAPVRPAPQPRPAPRVPNPVEQAAVSARPQPAPMPQKLAAAAPRARPDQTEDEEPPRRGFKPLEFNVIIRRDPDKVLKGTLKGKLTRAGLTLLRGKAGNVEIPVGTPTKHQAGNRLTIALSGREVEAALTKPNMYVGRLARDVAAFLNGTKPSLSAEDYAVPMYLLVLCLVPIGIAVGGMALKIFGTGAVGAGLNGGIWGGLGGGLVGVCWWIAQREQWSLGARIGASLGVSATGYLVLIVAAWLARGGPTIADSAWQEFAPPNGRCVILMPGKPQFQKQTMATPVGAVGLDSYMVERKAEDSAFMFAFSDYPPQAMQGNAEQLLDGAQRGAAKNINGKVVDQKSITLDGHPGREVTITIPGKGTMLARYYLVKNRFYQVAVAGGRVRSSSGDVQKFFASFKLRDAGAAKAPPDGPKRRPEVKVPPKKVEPAADPRGRIFLKGPRSDVIYLHYLPMGRLFAGHASGEAVRWNPAAAAMTRALPPFGGPAFPTCSAFAVSTDGRLGLRVAHGGPIELWDVPESKLKATLQPASPGMISIWAAALSADGKSGATAHGDQLIKLWDIPGQKLRHPLKSHKNQVSSVAFAPDGNILASASLDNTVKFWGPVTGKEIANIPMRGNAFSPNWKLLFSPDSKVLLVWRDSATAHLLDPSTRALRQITAGAAVTAVAVSPDSKNFATGDKDGGITLWDAAAGQRRGRFHAQKAPVRAMAFSPAAKKIALAFNADIEVWDLDRTKLENP